MSYLFSVKEANQENEKVLVNWHSQYILMSMKTSPIINASYLDIQTSNLDGMQMINQSIS